MDFSPMGDRLLIRPIKEEKKTKAGLILSSGDESMDNTQTAEIVAVGPGKRGYTGEYTPLGLEVGQKIMFVKGTGMKILIEGEDLLLIQEDAVLGKVGANV